MNSDVEFKAVDMPEANRLTIHMLAAVAEHEREMISQRTTAALAQAKTRGTRLGNPHAAEMIATARAAIVVAQPAPEVLQFITSRRAEGRTLREIAHELNRLGIRTPRGKEWYASTVRKQLVASGQAQDAAA